MIPLALAAVVTVEGNLQSLAGVTLGSKVAQILLAHPEARRSPKTSARWWRWSRREGGTVTITADDIGNITRVDFQADRGQGGSIDLPCVGAFPVRASDVSLNSALRKTACSAFNGAAYGLPDHSVVDVRFGPGYRRLAEATWYRPSGKNPSPVGHFDSLVEYLRPALPSVGNAARLYYAGECEPNDHSGLGQELRFPSVWLQRPLQGATGLGAVQQIFRDDPNITVLQDRSGMLRITIGSVSDILLQTRLPSLTLDASEQYTALSSTDKITSTVNNYAKEHGLHFREGPHLIFHLATTGAIKGAPHLPAAMQNISVDDALDAVARTFKGIVTYGTCMQPDGESLFWLDFIYGS